MDPLAEYEKNRHKGPVDTGYISVNALALVKLKKAFDSQERGLNQNSRSGRIPRSKYHTQIRKNKETLREKENEYAQFLKEDILEMYHPDEISSKEKFRRPLVGEMEEDIQAAYTYFINVLESIKTSLNYNHNRREEERVVRNERQSSNAKFFDYLRWRREISEIKERLAPLLDYRTSHADMELAQPLIDKAMSLLNSEPNTPHKKQTEEARENVAEVHRLLDRIEESRRARQRRHNNQREAANASRKNWRGYYEASLSQPSFFPNRARELSRLPASERSPARARSRSRERYSGGNRTRKNRNKK